VDGDTLHCGRERIRLLGIDAPELPGHCAQGRRCVSGDPYAATSSLKRAIGRTMRIERVSQDRYGRTLALLRGPHGDLSCWQMQHHQAIYRADWDNGGLVARTCPDVVRSW
jgi:endonuclease YncB( thermonuclease family)